MARRASVKLVGLDRVERNLEKLADRGKDNLEGLVRMATKEIATEAKRLAPVDSGDYRDSIAGKSDGITGYVAAWRGRRVHPLSHLIEFGTQPHAVGKGSERSVTVGYQKITVARSDTGSLTTRNKAVKGFGKQIGGHHPGTTAKPHLFPAFEMVTSKMGGRIADALRKAGGGLR